MAATRPYPVLRPPLSVRQTIARPSSRVLAVAALVGANVVWGGSAVASAAVLAHVPPLTLACLRVGLALAVLELLLARTGARPARGRAPALLGLTGVALFCACQNLGLRVADAATTALLAGAIPVLTALLAVPILGERLRGRRLLGLLVALVGVGGVVLLGPGASLGATALGNLLPLASAAGFAAYAVLGRRAFGFGGGGALAVVAGSTRYGLLFLLPGASVELALGGIGPLTVRDGLLLLYLGAGCSALAFVLYGYGLAHVEASQGAAFGNLKPLVGVALAVALLGERLTLGQMGGGALVVLGVVLAGRLPSASDTGDDGATVPDAQRSQPAPHIAVAERGVMMGRADAGHRAANGFGDPTS
jgi:drug/metabolite transporter (DMT)-like permease